MPIRRTYEVFKPVDLVELPTGQWDWTRLDLIGEVRLIVDDNLKPNVFGVLDNHGYFKEGVKFSDVEIEGVDDAAEITVRSNLDGRPLFFLENVTYADA